MVDFFKDKKFWKESLIILLVGVVINVACFCLPLVVHASGFESQYFPFDSGYNPNNYPIDDSYIKGLFSDPTVCMVKVRWENSVSHPDWYSVYILHDSSVTLATPFFLYGEVYTSNPSRFDVRTSSSLSGIYVEHYQYRDGAWSGLMDRFDGSFWNFTNLSGTIADPLNIYYVKQNLNKDSATGFTLINGMVNNQIVVGDFTDLPDLENILNDISNSFSFGSSGTQSTVDTNKSDIQNFIDAFNNLQNSITDNINNLGQNSKNWFDNLQKKLTDTTNAILGGIHDGFATLNKNFKDFFGAKLDSIMDKLDYISEPIDSETLLDGLENLDFYSDFSDLKDFHSDVEALLNIQEPSEFTLAIHFENFHDDFYSNVGTQEIDISFLHNSTLFRSFCWVVVCSGLTFIVASGIPSMLRGDKGD